MTKTEAISKIKDFDLPKNIINDICNWISNSLTIKNINDSIERIKNIRFI